MIARLLSLANNAIDSLALARAVRRLSEERDALATQAEELEDRLAESEADLDRILSHEDVGRVALWDARRAADVYGLDAERAFEIAARESDATEHDFAILVHNLAVIRIRAHREIGLLTFARDRISRVASEHLRSYLVAAEERDAERDARRVAEAAVLRIAAERDASGRALLASEAARRTLEAEHHAARLDLARREQDLIAVAQSRDAANARAARALAERDDARHALAELREDAAAVERRGRGGAS